ncbi:uncharacterized protein LOC120344172 [Styela clava]
MESRFMMKFFLSTLVALALMGSVIGQQVVTTAVLACNATSCKNGGVCQRLENGYEYCDCVGNYTGYDCALRKGECSVTSCSGRGLCQPYGEVYVCLCFPGFGGYDCEMTGDTRTCAVPHGDDDAVLFPACSLKMTLSKASECINENLPFIDRNGNKVECLSKMVKTVRCITDVVSHCSTLACEGTIWEIDLFAHFYHNAVVNTIYNMSSPFMKNLFEHVVCPDLTADGDVLNPNVTFDIGDPVCQKNLMDNLFTIMRQTSMKLHVAVDYEQCRVLDWTRYAIFNETQKSCNWSNIVEVLPKNDTIHAPRFADLLNKTQHFLLEWVVPDCRDTQQCLIECHNNGTCMSMGGGLEYCICKDGFGGHDCSLKKGNCSSTDCSGNGLCHQEGDLYTCSCYPMYDGYDCERYDESRRCAEPSDNDDAKLFPACSLKTFLDHASGCINEQLPYIDQHGLRNVCKTKMIKTIHCMTNVLTRCSTLACAGSIWDLQIFQDFYRNTIVPEVLSMSSPFMVDLYEHVVCPKLGPDGSFLSSNITFNIGGPVCQKTLIDNFLKILRQTGMKLFVPNMGHAETCKVFDWTRVAIFNETQKSCNWSNIVEVLSKNDTGLAPRFADLLNKTQHYFLKWVIPKCRDPCLQNNPCKNQAICDGSSGWVFCVCQENWVGEHCDQYDMTAKCPVPKEDDYYFLPKCTIKTTAQKLTRCFDGMDTYIMQHLTGQVDMRECTDGVTKTMHCIGETLTDCSRMACTSIYSLPHVPEIMTGLIGAMYNQSMAYVISHAICGPRPAGGWYQMLKQYNLTLSMPLNIGAPVCANTFVDDLLNALKDLDMDLGSVHDLGGVCRVMVSAKSKIVAAISTCNLEMIKYIPNLPGNIAGHLSGAAKAVRSLIMNLELPFCSGHGGNDECPEITAYSSGCQMREAYMCQLISYRKSLIEWQMRFMDWWQSCSNFAERDWDDWAYTMKLKRGDGYMGDDQGYRSQNNNYQDPGYGQMPSGKGKKGFMRMLAANFPCAKNLNVRCRNGNPKELTTPMGCKVSYCATGGYESTGNVAAGWSMLHMRHRKLMVIFNALSKDCSGSMSSCEFDGGSGPTVSSTTSMPYTTQWPTATVWSTGSQWPTGTQDPSSQYPTYAMTTDHMGSSDPMVSTSANPSMTSSGPSAFASATPPSASSGATAPANPPMTSSDSPPLTGGP